MKLIRTLGILIISLTVMISLFSVPSDKSTPAPWAKWEKGGQLDGGGGLKLAKQVAAFDRWYNSTIKSAPLFYTVNVMKDKTYEIYWDDKSEGTGKYTGDVVLWVFKMDGKTKYDSKDKGYSNPLKVKAAETTLNIVVTSMSPGTFAFGIKQVK